MTSDPFVNDKIASSFRTNTNLLQANMSPSTNVMSRTLNTSNVSSQPEAGVTEKRLDGLMQLLEREVNRVKSD